MVNSINTNVAAYFAQANISVAANSSASSVARLSSGNRIVSSSDDVAALSIGTSLQTGVSTLRVALTNASQGTSLLQVADGALSQITNILQRQKAIALQASSGSLTNTDRGFLDLEFQALSSQINDLTNSTTFNGVKLIDGSLSTTASIANVSTNATKGSSTITFSNTISAGETVIINGVTLKAGSSTSGTTFAVGGSIAETVDNLADALNDLAKNSSYLTSIGDATYSASGNTLTITSRSGGSLANAFTVTNSAASANSVTIAAGAIDFTEGSATATVTQTAHGYAEGDSITLKGAGEILGGSLYGKYTISNVTANTYDITLAQPNTGIALATDALTSTDVGAGGQPTVTVALANADEVLVVGQRITISGGQDSNNITAAEMNQTFEVASVSATGFTFSFTTAAASPDDASGSGDDEVTGDPDAVAFGGDTLRLYVDTNANTLTSTLASATANGQAVVDGGYTGGSLNLFATGSAITSATQIVSDDSAATNTPFQNGNSITLQVGGTTKTLFTLTDGGGTGAGGEYTLKDVVDGINANSPTTGVKAALTYSGGNYNVRLDYEGDAGNVILNAGANYNSDTAAGGFALGGVEIQAAGGTVVVAGATDNRSIYYTSYIDVLSGASATPINSGAIGTSVVVADPSATSAPFRAGDNLTIKVNGVSQTLHTFQTGEGIDDIVAAINAQAGNTGVYALAVQDANTGTAFNIRLLVNAASTTDTVSVSAGSIIDTIGVSTLSTNRSSVLATTNAALTKVTTAGLAGGVDDGLAQGQTSVTGAIGDSILQSLGTTKANSSILFTANASAEDYITIAGQRFTFTANTTAAPDEILIGATTQETVNNALSTIKRYVADGYALGNVAYQLDQLDFSATSTSLVVTAKGLGTVYGNDGSTVTTISQNLTSGALVGGSLNNGSSTYGVDVTGITNSAFNGKISGFTADYQDTASTVDLSVKIGDFTYTANDVNVAVSSDTRVRFYSDTVGGETGGYFDIQLKAGQVQAFTTQAAADVVASRLDGAFSSLSFLQTRGISSYTGSGSITSGSTVIGSLVGTSVSAQLASFDNVNLSDVTILAPSGSNLDAKITFKIGGVEFSTASGIGSKLGANQTYKLVSAEDPNQFINFTTGNTSIDLSTSDNALAAQNALKSAFGAVSGASALSFQIGATSQDSLTVSIGSAKTADLFGGLSLNVLTQDDAAVASAALDTALATVTSLRATVGALQSRFNFASANVQTSLQNQDAARGSLLDTDIATESTSYATSQVKLQAGISVLAQANQQLQALLKLIG